MTFTFSLAALGCCLFFMVITVAAIAIYIKTPRNAVTKSLRDGLTSLGVLAGVFASGFFVAWLFLWAAGI